MKDRFMDQQDLSGQVAIVAGALAILAGTCGKIARDVSLLM